MSWPEWAHRITQVIFPEIPAPAAWQAFQSLPGATEFLEALAKAFAFAQATPAREALVRAALAALGQPALPPPRTPLELAFREAHRSIWESLLRAASNLPLEPQRLQRAGMAALEILDEILEQEEIP
ncbi:MAG: hypothetical protein NZ572_08095 [Thermoflexus sp.]|nr:hypothetical protein [Thermoflexus sp.]